MMTAEISPRRCWHCELPIADCDEQRKKSGRPCCHVCAKGATHGAPGPAPNERKS